MSVDNIEKTNQSDAQVEFVYKPITENEGQSFETLNMGTSTDIDFTKEDFESALKKVASPRVRQRVVKK